MRKLLFGGPAAAVLLGGAMIAGAASAQTYYAPAPAYALRAGYHYDAYGRLVYDGPYAAPIVGGAVPVDEFGPDPNGMTAPDGHRIKCKLRDDYDGRFDRYVTHRVCY
jgi:hypothetical protein